MTTSKVRSGRTPLVVAGTIAVLFGMVAGLGGGALIWAHSTQRDSDGYYSAKGERLETSTFALTSGEIAIGVGGHDSSLGSESVRLRATAADNRPVFIGVALKKDVDAYLARSAHDELTDFEESPFKVELTRLAGESRPAAPASQKFWLVQASGAGTQTVTSQIQEGRWAVVVMNADGSAGVKVNLSVAGKTALLGPVGMGTVGAAVVALVAGAALLWRGTRSAGSAPLRGTGDIGAATGSILSAPPLAQ